MSLRAYARWWVVLALALPAVIGLARPASAHASLEAVHPHANSILEAPPAQVTLTFGEVVSAQLGGIKVFSPDGKRVDEGKVQTVDNNVSIDLKPRLANGTYTVSWRVISADSHPVSGGYQFSVGSKSSTKADISAATDPWTLRTMWLGRIGAELGIVLLVGALMFVCFVYPDGVQLPSLDLLARTGAAVLLLATAIEFLMEGPDAAGLSPGDAFEGALLRDIARTDYGMAHIIRAVLVIPAIYPGLPRLRRWIALPYAAGLAATFSFSGHAATPGDRAIAIPEDIVHVLGASVWLGGLVALILSLRARREAVLPQVARFSRLAIISVAAIAVTGTLVAIRDVGSWDALTSTRSGHLLMWKIGLFLVMLGLGYISHQRSKREQKPLIRAVGREAVAGFAIIAVTSSLVAAPQAKQAALKPFRFTRQVAPHLAIELDVLQATTGVNEVHIYVTDGLGKAVPVKELRATMAKPDDGVSPISIQLNPPKSQPIGHKENLSWEISIKGVWTFTVYTRINDFDEYSALYLVPIK